MTFKMKKLYGVWYLEVKGFNYPMRYSSLTKAFETMSDLIN